jgi:hypothetical protein
MDGPTISSDDLIDVQEMVVTLYFLIHRVFDDQEKCLCVSALASAATAWMSTQWETVEEAILWRDVFMVYFDDAIKYIKINKADT